MQWQTGVPVSGKKKNLVSLWLTSKMEHASQEITVIFNADTVQQVFFYSAEISVLEAETVKTTDSSWCFAVLRA